MICAQPSPVPDPAHLKPVLPTFTLEMARKEVFKEVRLILWGGRAVIATYQ